MMESTEKPRAANEPKIIKRYTNRKLYDTSDSRYVTLEEISNMVKQGTEVKILDNRNKEDLTSVTLAQIIFEEEKKKNRMPLSFLQQIIRHPGELISGFIQKELTPRVTSIREEADQLLDDWQKRVDERIKHGIEGVVGNLPALGRDLQQLHKRLEELEKKVEQFERKP